MFACSAGIDTGQLPGVVGIFYVMTEVWLRQVNSFVKADHTGHFRGLRVTICGLHHEEYGSNVNSENDGRDESICGIPGKPFTYSPCSVAPLKVSIIKWTQSLGHSFDPFT